MRRGPSGYTLAELMVWLAVMAIFASMLGGVSMVGIDAASATRKATEQTELALAVLERVGRDVRSSSGVVAQAGGNKTDATTLILEQPGSGKVTYFFRGGRLLRQNSQESGRNTVTVARLDRMQFRYDTSGPEASAWVEVCLGSGKKALVGRFRVMTSEGAP